MKKIIFTLFLVAGMVMSGLGLKHDADASVPAVSPEPSVNVPRDGGLVFSDALSDRRDTAIAWHSSHASHASHGSHGSHTSSVYIP